MIDYIKKINELLTSVDSSLVESFRLGKCIVYDEYMNEYLISSHYRNKLFDKCELLEVYLRALNDKLNNESENING
jgi:hypothetical protein